MKFVVVMFSACAVMALVDGGVVGSQPTAGGDLTDNARDSPRQPENATECPSLDEQNYRFGVCVKDDQIHENLQNFTRLEEFNQFYNSYCQEVPTIKHCLSEELLTSQRCYNKSAQQDFEILIGIMQTNFNIGCTDNGKPLAKVIYKLHFPLDGENVNKQCEDAVLLNGDRTKADASSDPGRHLSYYRKLIDLEECLIGRIQDDDELKALVRTFTEGIRREAKCIHPEHHTLVLCSTIDNNN